MDIPDRVMDATRLEVRKSDPNLPPSILKLQESPQLDEMASTNRSAPNKSSLAFNLETVVDEQNKWSLIPDKCEQGKPAGDEMLSFQCGHKEVQLSKVCIFEGNKSSKSRLLELPHTAQMDENSQWELKVKFARIDKENIMNGNITWEDLPNTPGSSKFFRGTRKLVVNVPGEIVTGPTAFMVIGIPADPSAKKFIKASFYHRPKGPNRGVIRIELGKSDQKRESDHPTLVSDVAVPARTMADQVAIKFFGLNPGIKTTKTLVKKGGGAAEAIATNVPSYFLGEYELDSSLKEYIQEEKNMEGFKEINSFFIELQFDFHVGMSTTPVRINLNVITGECVLSLENGRNSGHSGGQDDGKETETQCKSVIRQVKAFLQELESGESILRLKEHEPQLIELLRRFLDEKDELENAVIKVVGSVDGDDYEPAE